MRLSLLRGRSRSARIKSEITYNASTTDCGIACLKMILAAHGIKAGMKDVRSVAHFSSGGITVGSMIRAAKAFGMDGRAIRADLSQLPGLALPAVIHWRFNHFVVLESYTKAGVTLVDPSKGRLQMPVREFSEGYTGIAVEFAASHARAAHPRTGRRPLRQFLPDIRHLKRSVALAIAISLLAQVLLIMVPLWTGSLIDEVVPGGFTSAIPEIAGYAALLVVVIACAEIVQKELLLRIGTLAYVSSSAKIVDHLFRLGYAFFGARRVNDLASRVGHVRDIRDLIVEEAIPACIDGLFSGMILAVMFYINVYFGLISLVSIGGYAAMRIGTNKKAAQLVHEFVQADVTERGHMLENVKGALTLKGSNCEPERISIWQSSMDRSSRALVRRRRFVTRFAGIRAIIAGLDQIAHLAIATLLVVQGAISLGLVIAILMLRSQLHERAMSLIDRSSELFVMKIYAYRLSDVIESEAVSGWEMSRAPQHRDPGAVLRLDNVSFRYADVGPLVVRDASLDIAPGTFIGIRGASGEGKSTLIKLLIGLLEPVAGRVTLGGIALDPPGFRALRERSGVILQGEQLFSGTILENISWFGCERDQHRVVACARAACIHEDILRMPMGYHSPVSDSVVNLSGGQVQRILLARALYRSPQYLFLDEATSALDPALEQDIVAMLMDHPATKICISHRSLLLEKADIVFSLESGELYLETDRRPESAHTRA